MTEKGLEQFPGDQSMRIVSPEWVAQHADERDVRILDVRKEVKDYQFGHVPNAIHLAGPSLRAPKDGVPVQFLDPSEMASLFQRASINPGDTVVVYSSDKDVLDATMAAYALQRIGHKKVASMNGGIESLRQIDSLKQEYPEYSTGSISPSLQRNMFVSYSELRNKIGQSGVTIVDTRPVEDYLGNTQRWMRNGHIPSAKNLDWHQFMQPNNLHAFKPVNEMRQIVQRTGINRSDEIIVYCGTSREATLAMQVMKHALGFPNVRLYEGSWTEYCSKPDARIAKGRESEFSMGAYAGSPQQPSYETGQLEPYECGDITRLHTFKDIFLSSQPSISDFEKASRQGIKTVINQRHSNEIDFNERRVVEDLGMKYYNPAWNGVNELNKDVFERTRQLLREAPRPIMLHCSSANRTGAIWMVYRALDTGADIEQAAAEARQVGLRSPAYEEKARQYIRRKMQSR